MNTAPALETAKTAIPRINHACTGGAREYSKIDTSRFNGGATKDSCTLEEPVNSTENQDVDYCESN